VAFLWYHWWQSGYRNGRGQKRMETQMDVSRVGFSISRASAADAGRGELA